MAIRLLMFSAGIESKSMRLADGASVHVDVLMMDGPGAPFRPVGGESAEVLSPAEVPPWAEVLEALWAEMWEVEEPVSELLPAFFLLLLLLCLRPLLGYSIRQSSE